MRICVEPEVQKRLHDAAARYGMTGNQIAAAAAYELARVRPENLFHALGRIAAGEGSAELLPADSPALPDAKPAARRLAR